MSLTTRVSLFFLGTLALTLAGFSVALYFLIAGYLDGQLDQRLGGLLETLTAAIEVKKDCVEWEPAERRLPINPEGGGRWVVRGPHGRAIGASAEPVAGDLLKAADDHNEPTCRLARVPGPEGQAWRVFQVRLEPFEPVAAPGPDAASERGKGNDAGSEIHPFLILTAAGPLGPTDAALRLLLWSLVGLSLTLWSLAAVVGRWACRRTLAPVARMAASAGTIPADDPGRRLEVAATGDELEELGVVFNGVLDRLQEAFERQRRFTGEASHQLRTPLAVMLGQVEVALRRERPPEEYRRVLAVVGEQAGRLHRLVEMLLFLARADAEAPFPDLSGVDLSPWLEAHLCGWTTHPRAADLQLLSDSLKGARVRAHAPLLGQALDVLLDNACKYSRPGTGVRLSARVEGESVLLTVEDRGCGIEAEELPRVFEPFFRSTRQRRSGSDGTGLGLAIARRVVAAMGGAVEVESEPGCGSRFTIRLPRATVPEATSAPTL